jgi:hypothetical protein
MTFLGLAVPSNWADVGTLLGAIGTVAAVVVALWIAGRDGRRARRTAERAQAVCISAWHGFVILGPRGEAHQNIVMMLNGSEAPIWDVCVSAGVQHGAGPAYGRGAELNRCVNIVPPGRYRVEEPNGFREGALPGMMARLDAAISFRDADGRFWRRDATGLLTQTDEHPFEALAIERPVAWSEAYISTLWRGGD